MKKGNIISASTSLQGFWHLQSFTHSLEFFSFIKKVYAWYLLCNTIRWVIICLYLWTKYMIITHFTNTIKTLFHFFIAPKVSCNSLHRRGKNDRGRRPHEIWNFYEYIFVSFYSQFAAIFCLVFPFLELNTRRGQSPSTLWRLLWKLPGLVNNISVTSYRFVMQTGGLS